MIFIGHQLTETVKAAPGERRLTSTGRGQPGENFAENPSRTGKRRITRLHRKTGKWPVQNHRMLAKIESNLRRTATYPPLSTRTRHDSIQPQAPATSFVALLPGAFADKPTRRVRHVQPPQPPRQFLVPSNEPEPSNRSPPRNQLQRFKLPTQTSITSLNIKGAKPVPYPAKRQGLRNCQ